MQQSLVCSQEIWSQASHCKEEQKLEQTQIIIKE